jgi:hypothetical protein
VEQQKLLWAFCHGSTTQAIKKLGKLLPTYGTTTNSLGIFSQINSRNNTKYGKLFPTCGTTKTSLGILSWINNASNKKFRKLFPTCGITKTS